MGNQHVSSEVLAECKLPPERVKQIVQAFHKKNRKGKPIDRPTFESILVRTFDVKRVTHTEGSLLRFSDTATKRVAHLKVLFDIMDTNHDGQLDLAEVVLGLSILSEGTLGEKAVLVFHGMDRDCDGLLSREEVALQSKNLYRIVKVEIRAMMVRSYHAHYVRVHDVSALDDQLDVLMQPLKDQLMRQGTDHVFEVADTNKDGSISLKEWTTAVAKDEWMQWLVCPEMYWAQTKAGLAPQLAALVEGSCGSKPGLEVVRKVEAGKGIGPPPHPFPVSELDAHSKTSNPIPSRWTAFNRDWRSGCASTRYRR